MVAASLLQLLENTLHSMFGSMSLVALVIMGIMAIGFMFAGMDFRFAVMMVTPMILAFVEIGWFPQWVGAVFWMLVVLFGGYIAWTYIKRE